MIDFDSAGAALRAFQKRVGSTRDRVLSALAGHAAHAPAWEGGRAPNLHRDRHPRRAAAEMLTAANARPHSSALLSRATVRNVPILVGAAEYASPAQLEAGTYCTCGTVHHAIYDEPTCCDDPVLILRDRRA